MLRLRRAAALLEVAGVYLIGPVAGQWLREALGITVTNPLVTLRADISDAELIPASLDLFLLLLFQYVGAFIVIVPLNWWYRRRGPSAYGVTRGNRTWPALVLAGLATAALVNWGAAALGVANYLHPNEMAPWRQAFFDMSWLRWQFWLFAAVGSWALIPIVEELLYRGYYQRRLAEDWGNGAAIIAASCLFTFGHVQYQIPNLYNFGMILSLLAMAIGYGVVFAWTGSIVPSVIAHAIINVPMTLPWMAAALTLFVIGAFLARRPAAAALVQTFQGADRGLCLALGIAFGAFAAAVARLNLTAAVTIAVPAIAIALEAIDKRRVNQAALTPGPV